jgi:hypothetical protein
MGNAGAGLHGVLLRREGLLLARCGGSRQRSTVPAMEGILLQKSKVAGPLFFGENTKREAITDSYNLNRIAEVAGEFNVRR